MYYLSLVVPGKKRRKTDENDNDFGPTGPLCY
jgi:hypothetical protein